MTNLNNLYDWFLLKEDDGPKDAMDGGLPTTTPGFGNTATPSVANPPKQPEEQDEPSQDPQAPDMQTDDQSEDTDFETWQSNFFELAIKGDTNEMLSSIESVQNRNLTAPQRRFVSDNFQILLLRQDANFDKTSKEIRRLVNEELDRNSPSTSLLQHIHNVLQTSPVLQNILIKLVGQGGLKAELHRRMIGALLGAVQLGSGPGSEKPDLIYAGQDYTVDVSTRLQTTWGSIQLGKWELEDGDPEKYISDPELERLEEGSPEEKDVLRRRIIMESISELFKKRGFLVNVVGQDGTIYTLGWDLSGSLKSAYSEGKLIVRTIQSDNSEAMIDDKGSIIPFRC